MFETLQERLGGIFGRLTGRGALKEADVDAALREVRIALLEADVALPVVRDFIAKVRERAVGQEVVRSVTPGQMVVKIVHDHLVETLGSEAVPLDLNAVPPVVILMVGLQGSGKTTTTAKIAKRLEAREKKRVLMASLDVQRPAAQEQLRVLGADAGTPTLPIVAGQMPVEIARRAIEAAKLQGADILLLDTAGRLHVDEALMAELAAVKAAAPPHEVLLVADALTGQDAVQIARQFNERIGLTGIVLTRIDGDGRGGAALSMRSVTGCPIKLIGTGERLEDLEVFHPERIASRIIGMGDVVSLVEKAAETVGQEEAEKLAAKIEKGAFDLDDMAQQLKQMRKMGGMSGLLNLLPGVAKMKSEIAKADLDDRQLRRQEAILSSMTPRERRQPKILGGSRKKRIARGSGTTVQEVNRLLKQHRQAADMMKRMGRMSKGKGAKGAVPDIGALTGMGMGRGPGGPRFPR